MVIPIHLCVHWSLLIVSHESVCSQFIEEATHALSPELTQLEVINTVVSRHRTMNYLH